MPRFEDDDLRGAEFRECDLTGARFVGVVMQDTEIDGLVTNLVVNGVEVMPFVEAELDRRYPVRLLIRSDVPATLGDAWRQLNLDWQRTVARVHQMRPGSEHVRVDGEWSMVETLRHLVFVHDAWFRRCVLGITEPFTTIGLGPATVRAAEGLLGEALSGGAAPSLDDVLAVRRRQTADIEAWLAQVSPESLSVAAPVPDDGRWPSYAVGETVRQCLGVLLTEEWEHHRICERDLNVLTARTA